VAENGMQANAAFVAVFDIITNIDVLYFQASKQMLLLWRFSTLLPTLMFSISKRARKLIDLKVTSSLLKKSTTSSSLGVLMGCARYLPEDQVTASTLVQTSASFSGCIKRAASF
jgi:hypothetical protein